MRRLVVAMICAVLVVDIGAIVFHDEDGGDDIAGPDTWDPRVLDLVEFVEDERELAFDHPVTVELLTPEQYAEASRTDAAELTDEEREEIESFEAQLRALGLAPPGLDLLEASNDLSDTGTLAFYDPQIETVKVRGTDLTPAVQKTLVHELTHVLQDQEFSIDEERFESLANDGSRLAFRAVIEADANRIEDLWLESLAGPDREALETAQDESAQDALADLATVPSALVAIQQAPYALGPPLVQVAEDKDGTAGINALIEDPPPSDEHLLDLRAHTRGEEPLDIDPPSPPDGAGEPSDEGDFGAISWYVVLAERIDPAVALTAVDGWGGDAYTVYEQDGRTCMRIAFVGDTSQDGDEMLDAMGQWVAAMPPGAAEAGREGDGVVLRSCDLGDAAPIPDANRALVAITLPVIRAQLAAEAATSGGRDADAAFEYGNCFASRLDFALLSQAFGISSSDDLPPDVAATLQQAALQCL